MMPGMGGRMDPRRMNKMMKQLGIDVKEVPGVQEVVIKTADKDYVFEKPEVTIMIAQGQKTYQMVGTPKVREHETTLAISEEDVKTVAEQASVSEDEARKALEATGGDLAEAIVKLTDS